MQAQRLLRANGYLIEATYLDYGYASFVAERIDEFGARHRYYIGVAEDALDAAAVTSLEQSAKHHKATLVLVEATSRDGPPTLTWPAFMARLGGAIPSLRPLDDRFGEQIVELGLNRRPADVPEGDASDLYEEFVASGLEFLLGGRVIRYGSERRFRPYPDGLGLPAADRVAFPYDAKAADPAFELTRDDVRRFADYTRRYNEAYGGTAGLVQAFLVVSTEFKQAAESRDAHSRQLIADAGVPIGFLRSRDLAEITGQLVAKPWARNAIRWREIFASLDIRSDAVARAISEIDRDQVRR